jgi:hypothetical protein
VDAPTKVGASITFTGTPIRATGEVTLLGDPGDSAAGWKVGFVQFQWIETNWCHYRGQTDKDGSIFVQRGRPPARPAQACCDCVDGNSPRDLFYSSVAAHGEIATGTAADVFPLKLTVGHYDLPQDAVQLVEMNTHPVSGSPKPNFLASSQMEFHFCTILSAREPGALGAFHHLACFYWNVRWQATYKPTSFTNPPAGFQVNVVPAGSGAEVGHVIAGPPVDRRFTGLLRNPPAQSCNDLARAEAAGAIRHEAPIWKNFDVRKL